MHCISDLHVCSNPCSFQFPSLFLHFHTLLSFISLNPRTQLQNWKRYETLCYDKRIECGGSVNQACAHAVTRNAETILGKDKSMKSAKLTCKFRNVRGRKAGATRLTSQHWFQPHQLLPGVSWQPNTSITTTNPITQRSFRGPLVDNLLIDMSQVVPPI
jgi:hypothetical protein